MELNGGNLYDVNKNLIAQTEKPMSRSAIREKLQPILTNFCTKTKNGYYMLLNRENYDFTIFCRKDAGEHGYSFFASEMRECLCNRGEVYSIEENDNLAIEIWLKPDGEDELLVYYFFPYDLGVIEV